ncbi:MAG TPA: hypothetical protein PLR32_02340 [candidate division Zixibacteria bacterium]|nr:hypothetical protein [candidate division Zixibacteria bacterium]MDD4916853.1 hypothetical protein [candidate division Zixibacteria bacterium]MDM7973922.1 hypothetical protein [candidate division Zixibacteria bacterium]HOD65145.1 hypothetical protein [candidate division Zixibacteria bacterium]HOZ07224.1 hypothetical protein [candidate division Zixibacteria bacterium]
MNYRLAFILALLLPGMSAAARIVHNRTTLATGEDSLAVAFQVLDSLGNPTEADSIFISVIGPSGGMTAVDSMTPADARVSVTAPGGQPAYVFHCQVSAIDGAGAPGVYALTVMAKSTALGLATQTAAAFQIVAAPLSERLALLDDTVRVNGGVIDSNRTERGMAIGSGAVSVVLIAYDSTRTQVIPGVRVVIRDLAQTLLHGLGFTDVSGAAAFNLDADSVLAVAAAPGYLFPPFDTLAIVGATMDTLFGTASYPEPPPAGGLCRVWGCLYGIDGSPQAGATISAMLPSGVARFGGAVVAPSPVSTATDSTGLFQLDLIPSELLESEDPRYDLTIFRPDGVILRQRIAVPNQPLWQLEW